MISYSDIIGNIEAIAYPYISNKAHRKYRLTENLKNKAIACCGRVSDRLTENLKTKRSPVVEE